MYVICNRIAIAEMTSRDCMLLLLLLQLETQPSSAQMLVAARDLRLQKEEDEKISKQKQEQHNLVSTASGIPPVYSPVNGLFAEKLLQ